MPAACPSSLMIRGTRLVGAVGDEGRPLMRFFQAGPTWGLRRGSGRGRRVEMGPLRLAHLLRRVADAVPADARRRRRQLKNNAANAAAPTAAADTAST